MKFYLLVIAVFVLLLILPAESSDFTCNDGTVVDSKVFCDGVRDCPDGSDEIYVDCSDCSWEEKGCSVSGRTCKVRRGFVCNRSVNCTNISPCTAGCPNDYTCPSDANVCLNRDDVCNGAYQNRCPGYEGWDSGIGFRCVRKGKHCVLPQSLLWDNIPDCDDKSDLCYKTDFKHETSMDLRNLAGATFYSDTCFWCLDGSMIVQREQVCNGVFDCPDLSDECLCEKTKPEICSNVTLRYQNSPSSSKCPVGKVSCGKESSVCVDKSDICNGVVDCPDDNVDERFSYCGGTVPCWKGKPADSYAKCRCYPGVMGFGSSGLAANGVICNGREECPMAPKQEWMYPPGFPQTECNATCPSDTEQFGCTKPIYKNLRRPGEHFTCQVMVNDVATAKNFTYEYWCNGVVQCADGTDESNCARSRFTCKSGQYVNIPKSKVCDGFLDCDDGEDEAKSLCSHRFYCKTKQENQVSIDTFEVCDFNINCLNAEDEMNCTPLDGRLYCDSKAPLFVQKKKIRNSINDCGDWSDECSKHLTTDVNVLSSRSDMIESTLLRVVVWMMALLAVFGNLAVILHERNELRMVFSTPNPALVRANHMLISNLAVADLLMGIYLIMLAVASMIDKGSFCSKELDWLGSSACTAMGVFVVVSVESSLLTLFLIAYTRLYTILRPEKVRSPSPALILGLIVLSWIGAIVMGLIPLSHDLQGTFVEEALVANNTYFDSRLVKFDVAKSFALDMFSYSPELSELSQSDYDALTQVTSWGELVQFMDSTAPALKEFINVTRFYGYYSASTVCMPKHFIHRSDRSWQFALTLPISIFVVFVLVAVACAVIIYKSKKAGPQEDDDEATAALRRIVIRLVITDFVSWVPFTIVAFVYFSGSPISSFSYAASANIHLPMKSAVNPALYLKIFDRICRKRRENNTPESTALRVEVNRDKRLAEDRY